MEKKQRIIYLDLLRVLAIFAVMMIHVCASQYENAEVTGVSWQFFNFYDGLIRSAVPLLVMISGVFFLDSKREYPLGRLLKKNVKRLLVAYLFWAFAYACVDAVLEYHTINRAAVFSVIKNTLTGRYHLWFVNMMIALYLLVPFLRKIAEDERLVKYFLLLTFLFCYLGNFLRLVPVAGEITAEILEKMSIDMVCGYTGYFLAGYYFYHIGVSKKIRTFIYVSGILGVVVTIAGTLALSLSKGTADRGLYNYLLPANCLAAWAVFLFFTTTVSKISFSARAKKWISTLSDLSFGMYLVHDFFNVGLKKVGITTLSFPAAVSVPIISMLVFGLSFVTVFVLAKLPFARKYLM